MKHVLYLLIHVYSIKKHASINIYTEKLGENEPCSKKFTNLSQSVRVILRFVRVLKFD